MTTGTKCIFGHFDLHKLPCLADSCFANRSAGQRIQYFEIVWLISGSGLLQVDEQIFELRSNSLYFLAPGNLCRYDQKAELCGYHITFSLEFLYLNGIQHSITSWLESQAVKVQGPVLRNDTEMQRRIEQIILQMNREFIDHHNMSSDILSGLLGILLMYLRRKADSNDTCSCMSSDGEIVRKFLISIKRQFKSKRMVSEYAVELSMTPNYLNRVVKRLTGLTASDHIQQQIVLEAKRQIIQSRASLKEVAYNLGFDNLAHFSKFFKNKCGQNYSAFKRGVL